MSTGQPCLNLQEHEKGQLECGPCGKTNWNSTCTTWGLVWKAMGIICRYEREIYWSSGSAEHSKHQLQSHRAKSKVLQITVVLHSCLVMKKWRHLVWSLDLQLIYRSWHKKWRYERRKQCSVRRGHWWRTEFVKLKNYKKMMRREKDKKWGGMQRENPKRGWRNLDEEEMVKVMSST